MILEGAPATGLTMLVSTITSTMVRGQYTRYHGLAFSAGTATAPLSIMTVVKRLCLESLPVGPLGISFTDILLTVHLLYQFRVLEQRWGSNSFLSFLLTSALLGVCAMQMMVTESGSRYLSVDAVRILSAAGALVPLSALLARYMHEVPSRSTFAMRLPGTQLSISEKALVILPLLKLVWCPHTQLQAQTYRRAAVEVDVGGWVRLWCAVIGLLFGMMSTRSGKVKWWLRLLSVCCCRPLLRFLRPVTDALFGPPFTVDHAQPKHPSHPPQRWGRVGGGSPTTGGGVDGRGGEDDMEEGGRYIVDSLVGGDPLQEVRDRMHARRRELRQQTAQNDSDSGQARRRPYPQEDERRRQAIASIEAIGLGVSRDDIVAALDVTHNNLEMAVQLLLGNG